MFALLLLKPDLWSDGLTMTGDKHTALVELDGVIAAGEKADADHLVESLRDAFEDKATKGVILRINSPGGSPVQAGMVYREIRRLREKHKDIPLYAVVTDLCASGGYFIAAAADKIYADKASLVGSIGVLMNGFGFVDTLEKLGVERRLLTAGDHKGFLDPFSPLREDEVSYTKGLLNELHEQFISAVREGRGKRLKNDPDLFSGLIWSGEKAVAMGLVDEIGSAGQVARDVIGAEDIVKFTKKTDLLERLADRLGAAAARSFAGFAAQSVAPELR